MAKSNWSPVKDVTDQDDVNKLEEKIKRTGAAENEEKEGQEKDSSANDKLSIKDRPSDGSDSPEEVARRAKALGISMTDGKFRSPISNEVVVLDLAIIPQVVFENIKNFYLCSRCGKIYWDGSHYERTNNIYADVLGFDVNNGVKELSIKN